MNRLAFVLLLTACSKVDDMPALREEAHATVAYYSDQLDAVETRFQNLSRDGQAIKQVLPGGDEMGRRVVGEFNGLVELNKRMSVEAEAIKKANDEFTLAAHTEAYRALAEDGVPAGSDHPAVPSIAEVGSVLTDAESWLAHARTEMAALGSGGAKM